jgi:hypothetical protein
VVPVSVTVKVCARNSPAGTTKLPAVTPPPESAGSVTLPPFAAVCTAPSSGRA